MQNRQIPFVLRRSYSPTAIGISLPKNYVKKVEDKLCREKLPKYFQFSAGEWLRTFYVRENGRLRQVGRVLAC
jgi:hypothetical protein